MRSNFHKSYFSDKLSRSRFVTQLRHESRNVARCDSPTTRLSRLRQGHPDAGFDRNGCLASAGQWRVRTLTSLSRSALRLGVRIEFLTPDGFRTFPVPTYPGLRVALPSRRQIARRIEQADPDAVHIATEGPIGHMARGYCLRSHRPFTTSYTTRFPEYLSARVPIPGGWVYAALRRFHSAAAVTMV